MDKIYKPRESKDLRIGNNFHLIIFWLASPDSLKSCLFKTIENIVTDI
jgi:hypothetical protein